MVPRRLHALVEWTAAVAVGGVLLLLAGLLVRPALAPEPTSQGDDFVAQVAAPFAFDGKLPHRVLWPLLAHVASRLGIGAVAFSQACSGALLAVVFWFCRQPGPAGSARCWSRPPSRAAARCWCTSRWCACRTRWC
jgi:hypothetical protein